ncbi:MAG TPA: hypothetical protein VMZ06_02000 [Candidatus Bathyarchaeia archaeon]|nr:hypothetical protein [Candidatus Bathyarchaeia archaeon]
MRKEGAANKGMLILVALIIVAVVATVIMLQRGKETPVPVDSPAAPLPAPAPEPAPVTPIVEPPAPVEEPAAAVEEPPAPEQPAEVAPAEPPKEPLNARTLAGTKWKPDFPANNQSMMQNVKVEVEFAPDGTWRVNDQIRAKWIVEGKRVKIFDDKGEVHYLDIEGDKLMFEGKEIQRAN